MSRDFPIAVVGAGAGGLVVAIGAAKAGKKVVLIEKGNWGGDCTNFGCIPSKSLIAAASAASSIRNCGKYGFEKIQDPINPIHVLKRVRSVIKGIREKEDLAALKNKGVTAIEGSARFIDPNTLDVDSHGPIQADQIVIATGSSPFIPLIEGLDQVPYLTNETIFDLDVIPEHLGVLGGGPIGCELAQAFSRLGSKVTLIQRSDHLLQKEEPVAKNLIETIFEREGIELFLNTETKKISRRGHHIALQTNTGQEILLSHLLVAPGRRPNHSRLGLDEIQLKTSSRGIIVDAYGRTNYKHIYAVGDVTGRAIFTHAAENEARAVLTNLLLPWPLKFKMDLSQAIPRVTYTDPEVAACGVLEEDVKERGDIAIYTLPMKDVDRAICTGETEGFVKIITKKWSGKILGVTIVAPRAGEMLPEVQLAMREKVPLRKLASLIHPYPTFSRAIRKTADKWLTETILKVFKR